MKKSIILYGNGKKPISCMIAIDALIRVTVLITDSPPGPLIDFGARDELLRTLENASPRFSLRVTGDVKTFAKSAPATKVIIANRNPITRSTVIRVAYVFRDLTVMAATEVSMKTSPNNQAATTVPRRTNGITSHCIPANPMIIATTMETVIDIEARVNPITHGSFDLLSLH